MSLFFQIFLVALSFAYFAKALSGSYMKSTITQLERRFDIPSYLIGVIDGSFEIGEETHQSLVSFSCSICLPLSLPSFFLSIFGRKHEWVIEMLRIRIKDSSGFQEEDRGVCLCRDESQCWERTCRSLKSVGSLTPDFILHDITLIYFPQYYYMCLSSDLLLSWHAISLKSAKLLHF